MVTRAQNPTPYTSEALPDGEGKRFGLVVAQWHREITEKLAEGAVQTLRKSGVRAEDILRWEVPGSFELVYGSARMLQHPELKLDAVIAIGCIVQGETRHFEFICQGVTQGIGALNLRAQIPVLFCVLTDDTLQQSRARAGGQYGNKGVQCAIDALKMTALG